MIITNKVHNITIQYLRKLLVILLWLILWQVISALVKNPIFLPGPLSVCKELGYMLGDKGFYASVLASLVRILAGFFCAFVFAYALALLSGKIFWMKELLSPFITLCKTVPVASVVVLLIIWFGSDMLAFYITFMVVFPNIYIHVLEGFTAAPEDMLEMAEVFQLSGLKKYKYIYREAIWPHLESALKFSVGMSFKSGVAAEVIGLTDGSIGEGLYFDKIYLNTAGVFAWTFVIILLSFAAEKIILRLMRRLFFPGAEKYSVYRGKNNEKRNGYTAVELQKINKCFHEKCLFHDLSYRFETEKTYGIMGESGCGKTTLLRILAGLTQLDSGRVCYAGEESHYHENISRQERQSKHKSVSMQFQEDRLCEQYSAIENILLTYRFSRDEIKDISKMAEEVLGKEWAHRPVKELSGGMKRRVSFLRAVCYKSPLLLLDEPFTGLDHGTKAKMLTLLEQYSENRIVIVATHDETEVCRLEGRILRL